MNLNNVERLWLTTLHSDITYKYKEIEIAIEVLRLKNIVENKVNNLDELLNSNEAKLTLFYKRGKFYNKFINNTEIISISKVKNYIEISYNSDIGKVYIINDSIIMVFTSEKEILKLVEKIFSNYIIIKRLPQHKNNNNVLNKLPSNIYAYVIDKIKHNVKSYSLAFNAIRLYLIKNKLL